MSHLLGTQYCLNSLLQDVKDVQETVAEVTSRVGQVNYQSWKFPDKSSFDITVDKLLEDYKFSDDDIEHNQVSHIMLYDLLIDRMLYLFQCFTHFNEVLLTFESKLDSSKSTSKRSLKSTSAGLTVKKCWSRLSQVAVAMQRLARVVNKNKNGDAEEKSLPVQQPSQKSELNADQSVAPISHDVLNRSCQTHETIYVTCEVCSRNQSCLFEVGKSVVKVCKSQGLPTSLDDYIFRHSETNLLSIAELTRWKNLQTKDLSRIDRHLESLMKQIQPLKVELTESSRRENDYKSQLDQASVITERKLLDMKKECCIRESKWKDAENTLQKKVASVNKNNAKLVEEMEMLNAQISDMKDELLEKHRTLRASDSERSRLKEEAMEGKQYEKEALRLQSEVSEVCRKLQLTEEKLQTTTLMLEKEKNRTRTMQSHEEALQVKQQGLLHRFEELNEECEELREKVALAEEQRDLLDEELKQEKSNVSIELKERSIHKDNLSVVEKEKESLQRRISEMHIDINKLRDELEKGVERERLLVSYPDLHKSHSLQVIENSGDVYTDMRRQVEANQIRIDMLEKENANLRMTLAKLSPQHSSVSSPRQENVYRPPGLQLWNSSPSLKQNTSDIDLTFLGLDDSSNHSLPQPQHGSADGTRLRVRNKQPSPTNRSKKTKDGRSPPTRTSFSVGPGKRPSSRPGSGRSALLKPWT